MVNEGNAIFTTTDPRTPVEKYSNPFQYIFQQSMDYKISKESIFEVSIKAGDTSEYPYSQGSSFRWWNKRISSQRLRSSQVFPNLLLWHV